MTKVWNVSSVTLVILGRRVAPGRYVTVPSDRLKNAHKLNKLVNQKMVFVGEKPPGQVARAVPTTGAHRTHGHLISEVAAAADEAVEKLAEPPKPEPAPSSKKSKKGQRGKGRRVSVEPAPEPAPMTEETVTEESTEKPTEE